MGSALLRRARRSVGRSRGYRLSRANPLLSLPESLIRLGLGFGSVLVLLIGAEIATTLFLPRVSGPIHVSNGRITVGLDCYPTNPRGYFDLDLGDPATRERYRALRVRRLDVCAAEAPYAIELRYNSLQFRDEDPTPRRTGVRRLIVLGDSFTEGQGVKQSDTYPRVLERRLNALGPEEWEVMNFGRRGADFPALYENFRGLLAYQPDIVIYGMMLNDGEQSEAFRERHAFVNEQVMGRRRSPDAVAGRFGWFRIRLATLLEHRIESYRKDRAMTAWYRELYSEPNREGWERTQGYIREMDGALRARGGRFLLATWPVLAHLDRDYPFEGVHEAIARLCLEAGIAHHDLRPVLRGRPSASLWVHGVDPHPNEVAHRLAADSLAPLVDGLANGPVE